MGLAPSVGLQSQLLSTDIFKGGVSLLLGPEVHASGPFLFAQELRYLGDVRGEAPWRRCHKLGQVWIEASANHTHRPYRVEVEQCAVSTTAPSILQHLWCWTRRSTKPG